MGKSIYFSVVVSVLAFVWLFYWLLIDSVAATADRRADAAFCQIAARHGVPTTGCEQHVQGR